MRIRVEGMMPDGTTPRDLTLLAVGTLGSKGGLGRSIEFVGESIDGLDLSGRITLASMATEMGAICALMEPSPSMMHSFGEIPHFNEERSPKYDENYPFAEDMELDISDLEPMISRPGKPDDVIPVREIGKIMIDSVFIGSCTNGSFQDMEDVARVVRGKHVARGVMAKIVPATRKVWGRMLEEGLMKTLHEAGFVISNSGCGGCASGQIGMTGTGEVQVSTSNRNFPGKQGKGDTYLASPETATASAILGRIGTVDELG
jgi:3-isopropylmalate/(R)-2-methylmalate dehydratase large subunit